MKRFAALLLAVLLPIATLPGRTQPARADGSKISVVCTIFPQYDWVRQILGDQANGLDLTLLLNNKIDLHNYQPSVEDIVKISTCDLFIYVGGESDGWVDNALKEATNGNMIAVNMLEALGDAAKAEEALEGMEAEDHGDEDEAEYDEHVWLSLKNAATLCPVIADALCSLDAGNAEFYRANAAAYIAKLQALDAEYRAATDAASVKTLLFGDRFPFRYLMDDYGLTAYAAFSGCSAETEASFETVVFLANKADELGLRHVMVTESSDRSIAGTIIANTAGKDQDILVLDAMQSVTSDDVDNGASYLSIMKANLNVLKDALA